MTVVKVHNIDMPADVAEYLFQCMVTTEYLRKRVGPPPYQTPKWDGAREKAEALLEPLREDPPL